jgi:hypothetical protein
MGVMRNAYTALMGTLKGMRTLVKSKQRREDNIKIGTEVIGRMWTSNFG